MTALQNLRAQHLNVDNEFCLPFKERCDNRDARPMVYPGRMVFSGQNDPQKTKWKRTPLIMDNRTAEVPQMKSGDMEMVENLAPESLPNSTDDADCIVQGARKFEQIGVPACEAILQSVVQDLPLDNNFALLLEDYRGRTGQMLHAFLKMRQGLNFPAFALIGCDDMVELDWIKSTTIRVFADRWRAHEFSLPGVQACPKEMPADLLESAPPIPKTNVLVVGGPKNMQLLLPPAFVKEWSCHPTFGEDFKKRMEAFHEEFGHTVEENDAPSAGTGKRPASAGEIEESASKRKKVAEAKIVDMSMVVGEKLHEIVIPIKGADGQVKLNLRAGNKLFLCNLSGKEVNAPAGTMLCGFGKTTFKLVKGQEAIDSTMFLFTLRTSEDLVVLNGVLTTVGAIYNQRAETDPDAKICYHDLEVKPDDPKKFTLTVTHRVVAKASEANVPTGTGESSQLNFGNKLPSHMWDGDDLKRIWIVRWTNKGLSPVKHAVFLTSAATIPVGRAVALLE